MNELHQPVVIVVSLTITPEKVKKWYYNQVVIDHTQLLLLLPFFFFLFLSRFQF